MFRLVGLVVAGLIGFWSFAVFANEEHVDLGSIVVTPLHYEESMSNIPAAVSVISREDIERTNASSIADVLRRQNGLLVRDYNGTGSRSAVDIRGFGETAGMNTLVLLDGRRVNSIDLAGTDWTQIDINFVERIEIIRGSGGVLYGDNASGGVVNIITRSPTENFSSSLSIEAGSYDRHKEAVSVSDTLGKLGFVLSASDQTTDGYRQNSDFEAEDYNARLDFNASEEVLISLHGSYHDARLGLPGALRVSHLKNFSRKQSLYSDDRVFETDQYFDLCVSNPVADLGALETVVSFRRREVQNKLISSQSKDNRRIDTYGLRNQFISEFDLFSIPASVVAGAETYRTESLTDQYSDSSYDTGTKMRSTHIDKDTAAGFMQTSAQLTDDLDMIVGYRYEAAHYDFDSTPQPGPWMSYMFSVDDKENTNQYAWNWGLNYSLAERSRVFANISRGFRFGATDEYYSLWSIPAVNTTLRAQRSLNYELGAGYGTGPLDFSATLFLMKVKDELYYDPILYSNGNYGKTDHRGAEVCVDYKITSDLTLHAQYTFTRAQFVAGSYGGNQIPFVPRHAGALSVSYMFADNLSFDLFTQYVGQRWFISDQAHNYPKMKDYITTDIRVRYNGSWFETFAGVNNLFNVRYSEYGAISTMYGEQAFYPSPERNFVAGVELSF